MQQVDSGLINHGKEASRARGIVFSDIIIAAGFAIFALPNFSPTQRFGLVASAGTVIDILGDRFTLAVLAGAEFGKPMALVK